MAPHGQQHCEEHSGVMTQLANLLEGQKEIRNWIIAVFVAAFLGLLGIAWNARHAIMVQEALDTKLPSNIVGMR